jgi:subtilisin family serine protease
MTYIKKLTSLAVVASLALVATTSRAAVIAIVDSGTDVKHPDLASKIWNNQGEIDDAVDNDNNGYVDDLYGWNFADNNNRLVDKKLIGTFSPDCYKYFEIQTKALNGVATQEEIAWIREKVQDQKFIQELESFGNHVHGSHVAGIASRDAAAAHLMILRMITNGQPNLFIQSMLSVHPSITASSSAKEKIVYAALGVLASQQGKGLAPIGKYLAKKHADVANCSFGASRAALEPTLKPLIEKILGKALTDEDSRLFELLFGQSRRFDEEGFDRPCEEHAFCDRSRKRRREQ